MIFYRSHFGRRLKEALKSARLSQRQLAEDERIGVDPSAVSKWVNGEDMPAEDRLPSICKVLKVDADYFDPDRPDFGAAGEFLSTFASAPPDIQKLTLAILNKDASHLRTASREFRQKAIDFLKGLGAF